MALTYHWITKDWEFCSLTRDVILVPHCHSSINLASLILDRISLHFPNPQTLLGCISTDCAANI
jgi:hypothetical protein